MLTLYAQQVLGFSPVKFGLTSLVFPLTAAAGAIVGQGLVLKIGFRPIATTGLILLGIGSLYLTQVSAGGSYFGDIFIGLLLYGPGVGLTFVTCSIAALAGVDEREAGVASGLSNTTFQIGAAVGTAIVSTVAVTRTDAFLTDNRGASPLVALTEGLQCAFLACVILAGIGLIAALMLLGRTRSVEQDRERLEAAMEPEVESARD